MSNLFSPPRVSFGGFWGGGKGERLKRIERGNALFFWEYSVRCQVEHMKPSVADEAIVGRGRNGDFGIEKGGIFHGAATEALGSELEHVGRLSIIIGPTCIYEKMKASLWALWEFYSAVCFLADTDVIAAGIRRQNNLGKRSQVIDNILLLLSD